MVRCLDVLFAIFFLSRVVLFHLPTFDPQNNLVSMNLNQARAVLMNHTNSYFKLLGLTSGKQAHVLSQLVSIDQPWLRRSFDGFFARYLRRMWNG